MINEGVDYDTIFKRVTRFRLCRSRPQHLMFGGFLIAAHKLLILGFNWHMELMQKPEDIFN